MHPDSPFINARYCRDGSFNPQVHKTRVFHSIMLSETNPPNQVLEGTNHEIYHTSPADIGLEHYAGPPTSSFSTLLCPLESPNPAPNAELAAAEPAEHTPEPNLDG